MSPEDVDTAVSQGLGLRWSFMGPFETIDLNAPGGVEDYCERYGESITAVCEEQSDARKLKHSATAKVIHDAMRARAPLDSLPVRHPDYAILIEHTMLFTPTATASMA